MISHKLIKIEEKVHTSNRIDNQYKIFCGKEVIGNITEYKMSGTIVTCYFNHKNFKEVESLKEGVKYIEKELEAYISNIIRVDA